MIRDPFTMVVLIVLIVTVAGLIRAKLGIRRDNRGNEYSVRDRADDVETQRLREEVKQLKAELGAVKDRLANVERIVTDDSHRLTQEIDSLRLPRN